MTYSEAASRTLPPVPMHPPTLMVGRTGPSLDHARSDLCQVVEREGNTFDSCITAQF
jgi:hypothetical protein